MQKKEVALIFGLALPVVQTSECAKKCANDVPLVYDWASADLRSTS